jgi:segregation and condensation protein A
MLADYRVNLDIFAGPMDLLLYLVRKEEVDIYDIPISRITDQYLRYIDLLKQFDIDVAGDFLVMAATLMEIKSAMLLPKVEPESAAAEDANDPRSELIRQLLEYKRFKDAANLLDAAAERQQERFCRPSSLIRKLAPQAEPQIDMDQVSIWDLLEAFDAVCKATGYASYDGHIKDDTPIDLYQIEVLHRLQTDGPLTFERVFDFGSNRLVMVGIFLAVLELIRAKLIWAEQNEAQPRQIYLRSLTDEPAEQVVPKVILAVGQDNGSVAHTEVEQEQMPPIPIVEVPAPDSPDRRQDEMAEDEDETLDEQALEPDLPTEASPLTRPELPIPIVELPPKRESAPLPKDQPQSESADSSPSTN